MQGYIAVDIPTKPYIKAYVISKLGPKPEMRVNANTISSKLYDILQHKTNERKDQYQNNIYKVKMRLYIPVRTFKIRGAFLNETNIKNFNRFIENEIKQRFYHLMDDYLEILPNFESNLPEVRRKLGIDIDAWSDDSMRKDFYRHRIRTNKKLLYNK